MSTNKTQNYALHAWLPTDDFQLSEVNQNFAALDAALTAKAEIVTGSYAGDGTTNRVIDLGRKPVAVFAERDGGFRHPYNVVYGGLVTRQLALSSAMSISDTGFTVTTNQGYMDMNDQGMQYNYIAFFIRE